MGLIFDYFDPDVTRGHIPIETFPVMEILNFKKLRVLSTPIVLQLT